MHFVIYKKINIDFWRLAECHGCLFVSMSCLLSRCLSNWLGTLKVYTSIKTSTSASN